MTETTALLRAIHYDLAAANGLTAALIGKINNKPSSAIDHATVPAIEAMVTADKYRKLADELAEEAANDAQ